ncbi:hypothetical protein P280DRAFT_276722 [Massarina eburnea CBS 473.64]|uniref:Uncharacterized protein n=1 Tax=Massarina eburnea CBS 473.64 TaxID=1395130 RepID=A0A6A6S539_9PLEO|nr:hypothetical protein P280DRAFT_276722 [Massarina eburnea CBS 473.64]
MAPSPRTAPTFEQTWSEADAAFLDPSSLAIAKVPRAWDRKQETKVTGGKQKTVWRRYSARLRGEEVEPEEEEVHDSQTRAVKKLQCMSPQAIEKSSKLRLGKKSAFKATRWDHRKSMLPRKKTMRQDAEDVTENDMQDTTDPDISNTSFSTIAIEDATVASTLEPEKEDSRATFTFAFGPNDSHPSPLPVKLKNCLDPEPEHEATLVNFFRSPVKNASPTKLSQPSRALDYLQLARLPEVETERNIIDTEDMVMDGDVDVSPSPQEGENVEESDEQQDEEMSERAADFVSTNVEENGDLEQPEDQEDSIDEQFTEASLQLDIQEAMSEEQKEQSEPVAIVEEQQEEEADGEMERGGSENVSAEQESNDAATPLPPSEIMSIVDDMTDGLTLGTFKTPPREPTPRKLRSPSPPLAEQGTEDTMTMAIDDDTAMLKDFLSRAAAIRASKAASISRRESLQNRRDSDVVRDALASPRKVLEDKDPNSPSKYDNDATLDLSQTLTLSMSQALSSTQEPANEEDASETAAKGSRRSSRARKSRLPAPASTAPAGPSRIAVRRDGGEPIVLKKSDAQELSQVTRNNTRKNKQGAFAVNIRLLKLSKDASTRPTSSEESTMESVVQVPGKKYVRWDEQLAYYQEGTDTMANMAADAESLATPDELSLPAPASVGKKARTSKDKALGSTPKAGRARGLGATNGTPGKGLLTPGSLLPDAVQEEKESAKSLPKPKAKSSKARKVAAAPTTSVVDTTPAPTPTATTQGPKLPTLEAAPAVEPKFTARKSRLATPRKVKLPQSTSTIGAGKENEQRIGLAAGTPKKGIPVPSAGAPSSLGVAGGAMETGLPRRRGRKV